MRTISNATSRSTVSKRLSAVLAATLVVSILSASSAVAEDPDPVVTAEAVTPVDSNDDGVFDAPDTVSAVMAADTAGEPVEDFSARTETSGTVVNPDGTFTLTQHGTVQRVRRDGQWADVDYTLQEQADGDLSRVSRTLDVC